MDVIEEFKFFGKIHKKKIWGGVGGFGRGGGLAVGLVGGQGGCERRIEVFRKIHQKQIGGGGGWLSGCWGNQGGCDRRIEVFWENSQKKNLGGGGRGVGSGGGLLSGWWGVRVDVNEEFKFL